MKPLYKDELPALDREFQKEAAFAGRLSEQPENWPQELTSDLFKQLPFLSDYDVNVNMERMDAERGFAYGYADVHNKTERPEQEHDEAGLPHIRVPLVVAERMVKPFSVFMDGEKVMPLNEERVREHLFNPGTFDLSTTPPQDPSLVEPLMPPHRSGIGMGGDYKLASVDERLLLELSTPGKAKKAAFGSSASYPSVWAGRAKRIKAALPKPKPEAVAAAVAPKIKVSFKHISQEQWQAMYNSLEVQKLVQEYGSAAHPAVQNKVYEMATKMYGYHPKPEPPPPHKLQEHHQKMQDKQQKASEKQQEKAKKLVTEGQKLMNKPKTAAVKTAMFPGVENVTPEQWGNIYDTHPGVKALVKKHGRADHPAVDMAVMQEAYRRHGSKEKRSSLLLAIAPTLRERDVEAFVTKVAEDTTLRAGFLRSGIAPTLVEAMDKTKRASADERLAALAENILPTVVTIQKLPGGDFFVKQANNEAFAPDQAAMGETVPPEAGAEMMGDEQAQAMQPGQSVTAVSEPQDVAEMSDSQAVVADRFGQYIVQDLMGNQLAGWVFPTTVAWDGNFSETPVALFTNGSAFAVQDAIAGELIGMSMQLPIATPRGEGSFYEVSRTGTKATAPVTVKSGMTGPDGGEMYVCVDMMGNEFTVHMSPELVQPQRVSDTEYAIPVTWKFMPLMNQTQLIPDPVQMNKVAHWASGEVAVLPKSKLASSVVRLYWNGTFNFEGGCGLSKVASSFRQDLDSISAEFMLGLLGVPGADIKEKLSQARKLGSVDLYNLKTITPLAERYQGVEKTAQSLLLRLPNLRRDLIKEAAALEDESTVDKVLALNFINPENLTTFISYIPELEQTSEKLAEMLLSSYLGMSEVPEGAVERSMKNMEEVILALKAVENAEA